MAYQVKFLIGERKETSPARPDPRQIVVPSQCYKGEFRIVTRREVLPDQRHCDVGDEERHQHTERHDTCGRSPWPPGKDDICIGPPLTPWNARSADKPSRADHGHGAQGEPARPKILDKSMMQISEDLHYRGCQ